MVIFDLKLEYFWRKSTNFIWKNHKKGLIKAKNDLKGLPTELEFEILSAVDINNNVLGCYRLNNRKIEDRVKNADCTAYEWEKVAGYNTLVCSPPCQESLLLVPQFKERPKPFFMKSMLEKGGSDIERLWNLFFNDEFLDRLRII